MSSFLSLRNKKIQPKDLIALFAGSTIALSLSHHAFNVWELPLSRQLLALVVTVPVFSLLVNLFLSLTWDRIIKISWKRWLLFLLPVLVITSFITWCVLKLPVVWHELEIIPPQNAAPSQIQLLEIKDSNGIVVKFSELENIDGWSIRDGVLINDSSSPGAIRYSFLGPIYRPVSMVFFTSPSAGTLTVTLDGKSSEVDLVGQDGGQRAIEINTRYRLGINSAIILWLIIIMDLLSFTFLFAIIWLMQEIQQVSAVSTRPDEKTALRLHRRALTVLLVLSLVLHFVNYFSVPLILDVDSPGYIEGAVHWAQYRNLEGASSFRGPGSSFVFLPAILLFGRNPWGMKLLLHLLAFLCVPLSYILGWQLSKKYWFAFLAGLLTALTPDLFFYSNYVMSEMPNIFFMLLYCVLLLSAIETLSPTWIIAAMLVGSFTVLIRTENLISLFMGIAFLIVKAIQKWISERHADSSQKATRRLLVYIGHIGLGALFASLPILAWSNHNYRNHGFWGLSNYAGEVFYTGWVYEGEASRIPITDQSSPAVQIINEAYWKDPRSAQLRKVPTGWQIHPFLVEYGYTEDEAFSILRQAALDSITNDYRLTLEVVAVKVRDSFRPETAGTLTFPLPGETITPNEIKARFFDEEQWVVVPLVQFQRRLYEFLEWYFANVYPIWAWICVGGMFLSFYRKPVIPWMPIVLIALFRVGLPNFFGFSHWRFVVSGLPLMQILALAGLQSLLMFFAGVFRASGTNRTAHS
jgi:4-amino-4-deoxy-L-arabinose transferase-like glycosyltransferase